MIFPASHAKKNKPKTLDHMRDQQELASWLSSPDLRNFHHFEFESAERKQKFIKGKEDFFISASLSLEKYKDAFSGFHSFWLPFISEKLFIHIQRLFDAHHLMTL